MGHGLGIGGYIAMLCLDSFRRFIDAYSTTLTPPMGSCPPRVTMIAVKNSVSKTNQHSRVPRFLSNTIPSTMSAVTSPKLFIHPPIMED